MNEADEMYENDTKYHWNSMCSNYTINPKNADSNILDNSLKKQYKRQKLMTKLLFWHLAEQHLTVSFRAWLLTKRCTKYHLKMLQNTVNSSPNKPEGLTKSVALLWP